MKNDATVIENKVTELTRNPFKFRHRPPTKFARRNVRRVR
jgi:hypothetical protein